MDFFGKRPLAVIRRAFSGFSSPPRTWTPPVAETPDSFRSWHSGQYLTPPTVGPDYEPAPHKNDGGVEPRGRSMLSGSRIRSSTRDRRVHCNDYDRRRSVSEPAKKQRQTFHLHVPPVAAKRPVSPLRAVITGQNQVSTSGSSSTSYESAAVSHSTSSASPSRGPGQGSSENLRTALEEALKEDPQVEATKQKMLDSPAMITLRRASEANSHQRRPTPYSRLSAAPSMPSVDSFDKSSSSPAAQFLLRQRKSLAADTATTFTDVHASAPSIGKIASEANGAFPGQERRFSKTSQIVCTRDSVYEVVWEDTLDAESPPVDAYSSSSSPADEPSGPSNLQLPGNGIAGRSEDHQINTKLAAWSWTGSTEEDIQDESNKKQAKVRFLPPLHDASGSILLNPSVKDGGCLTPPNSINPAGSATSDSPTTSPESSTNPSRTASGNRLSPSDDLLAQEGFQDRRRSSTSSLAAAPARVADKSKVGHALGASGHKRKLLLDKRVLSNLAMDERRFEEHRDSVALARNRIRGDRYSAQEPRRFRDSIAVARSRLDQGGPYKRPKDDQAARRRSVLSPIPDASPSDNKPAALRNLSKASSPSGTAGVSSATRTIRFVCSDDGPRDDCLHCLHETQSFIDDRKPSVDWIG